ncbi:hypothetical protein FRC10_004990 [Ceratobasidium sp. 414]|nr:hypothetical protein FRC10_004990 [Ceratobasidium sp. 414]
MSTSSAPRLEGQGEPRGEGKREVVHTVIIFSAHSPTMEQLLANIRGESITIPDLFWTRGTRVKSSENSVVLLQASSFEKATIPDSTAFSKIALDLGQTPSLVTQRNFRALWHLKKLLNLASLSLCVISPTASKETPPDLSRSSALQSMMDFKIWREHLIHPRSLTINRFVGLILGQRQNSAYAAPAELLTKDELNRTFCQVETEYFKQLQDDRTSRIGYLEKVQGELQKSHNEAQMAQQELENLTVQHNSLLQQLNLRDNTEVSDIAHQFRGLNDEIDEISLGVGRAIADDLYKRYPNCEKSHDPAGLRQCLGMPDGPLLLFQSGRADPVGTRQFLEFYAASVVCHCLHAYVFSSFHPIIPGDSQAYTQSDAFTMVYRDIRLRDPQIMSAKWRVDTYSTLLRLGSARRQELTDRISSYIASLIMAACGHLFGNLIKPPTDNARLIQLVTRALKLNDQIKQEVVHAGDIHTEYFHYNHPYDDLKMKVLDSDEGDSLPAHIVSTCGLGVGFTKAVGGGKEPESSILLKAIVVSEQLYN